MENVNPFSGPAADSSPSRDPSRSADIRLAAMSSLLENIDAAAPPGSEANGAARAFENTLVQVRLGLASSLFAALRAKHAPTAAHSLRVALGCSSWAMLLDASQAERDEIEIAALLHDLGKVGVPDPILTKPGRLSTDETTIVERHRQTGCDILQACCVSENVLSIIRNAGAWYDGSREGYRLRGDELPLGARMVAIVDAFDAMTNDQVYRNAMSRERSVAELFEFAGTQFDPQLVRDFCGFISADQGKLSTVVAHRWLKQLDQESSNSFWQLRDAPSAPAPTIDGMFQQKLLESMHDAVIFVDHSYRILLWNRAAERLTGITAASIEHQQWSPELMSLRDERNKLLSEDECPVIQAIQGGVQTLRRLSITGRNGQRIEVDAHLVPVHGKGGVGHGAALLMHDASSQITLEQRVQSLHEKATRDPLTQVANRAEFDRTHAQCVELNLEQQLPCSLIICDIDHFKRVNDTYGHQAGDDVLTGFAALLRRHCRPGDLVARYGGEEFVMLCVDCNNTVATRKAEQLRAELAELPHTALNGKSVTASFGVTELQNGDTAETMLRRADRALYQAKENGRNAVVQLGAGMNGEEPPPKPTGWFAWLRGTTPDQILERSLVTAVPLNVVVEKMRGFVADHHAEIESVAENHLALKIEGEETSLLRRATDRSVPFCIDLKFDETHSPPDKRTGGVIVRTLVRVTIRPQRSRDRRRRDTLERAQKLLVSLKSYLVAQEFDGAVGLPSESSADGADKAKSLLSPWLGK